MPASQVPAAQGILAGQDCTAVAAVAGIEAGRIAAEVGTVETVAADRTAARTPVGARTDPAVRTSAHQQNRHRCEMQVES